MGDMVPVRPQVKGSGSGAFRAFLLALCYVVFVPVAFWAFLWCAVTYFPGPAKALLGPVVNALIEPREVLPDDKGVVQSRLAQIEGDIALLKERLESLGQAVDAPEGADVNDAEDNGYLLAALAGLTVARVEYLSDNRATALREVRLVLEMLAPESYQELRATVSRAAEEISRGSSAAGDWLSVAWHSVVDAMVEGFLESK